MNKTAGSGEGERERQEDRADGEDGDRLQTGQGEQGSVW